MFLSAFVYYFYVAIPSRETTVLSIQCHASSQFQVREKLLHLSLWKNSVMVPTEVSYFNSSAPSFSSTLNSAHPL